MDPRLAENMLRAAQNPQQLDAVLKMATSPRQGGQDRYTVQHDREGNWVVVDKWTGALTPYMPQQGQPGGPQDMFKGQSLEGQALNHLVRRGTLSQDEAAQVAAGKQVTGSDGAIYFLRPQDIAGGAGGGLMRQPAPPGGETPAAAPASGAPAAARRGTQLTPPKPEKAEPPPAEVAARIGLGNTFLEAAPEHPRADRGRRARQPESPRRVGCRLRRARPDRPPHGDRARCAGARPDRCRHVGRGGPNYVKRYEPSWRDDRRNFLRED